MRNVKTVDKDALYGECLKRIKKEALGKPLEERMKIACKVLKAQIPYYF